MGTVISSHLKLLAFSLLYFFALTRRVAACSPSEITPIKMTSTDAKSIINKKWVLSQRPNGVFQAEKDARFVEECVHLSSCKDNEIIVDVSTLSVDAFIRTMLDKEAYHGSINIGDTIPALGYGSIIHAGRTSKHKVGSVVIGMMGSQTFATVDASQVFTKMNLPFMPTTSALGLMGLTTGLTAYTGVFYVCKRPRKGETVVVTGAAGAVGSVAAQLAKTTGARVVGIAGGKIKTEFLLNELKLDGAVDYKCEDKTLEEQLKECCPNGIDFIYDNVGGKTLDAILDKINPRGRVVICGAISQYSGNLNKGKVQGPSNYLKLAEQGAVMAGFNVMQYMSRIPLALLGMFWYYMMGKVKMIESREQGIKSFPTALEKLFSGQNIGKTIVELKTGLE